jgi:hypothetical protein
MRVSLYALLAVLLTAGIAPLAAAQFVPPGTPSPEIQRRQLELAARAAAKLVTKPKVTCGTTVVPADPKVDPKAIKPVPDQATTHTIRQVPPGACR